MKKDDVKFREIKDYAKSIQELVDMAQVLANH